MSSVICGLLRYFHQSFPNESGVRSTTSVFVPSIDIDRSNPRSMPLMVVNIAVTDTMPITMPSVVSSARSFDAHTATNAMRKPSTSSDQNARTEDGTRGAGATAGPTVRHGAGCTALVWRGHRIRSPAGCARRPRIFRSLQPPPP